MDNEFMENEFFENEEAEQTTPVAPAPEEQPAYIPVAPAPQKPKLNKKLLIPIIAGVAVVAVYLPLYFLPAVAAATRHLWICR